MKTQAFGECRSMPACQDAVHFFHGQSAFAKSNHPVQHCKWLRLLLPRAQRQGAGSHGCAVPVPQSAVLLTYAVLSGRAESGSIVLPCFPAPRPRIRCSCLSVKLAGSRWCSRLLYNVILAVFSCALHQGAPLQFRTFYQVHKCGFEHMPSLSWAFIPQAAQSGRERGTPCLGPM